jgi:hypothetical protein
MGKEGKYSWCTLYTCMKTVEIVLRGKTIKNNEGDKSNWDTL